MYQYRGKIHDLCGLTIILSLGWKIISISEIEYGKWI